MASAGSGGRAASRDGEANGEPDRSLQLMLRAIAEERSRTGLRHEISGLGEGRRRPGRERAAAAAGGGPEGCERRGAARRLPHLRCLALLGQRPELLRAESVCRVFGVRTLGTLADARGRRVVPVGFSLRPASCPALLCDSGLVPGARAAERRRILLALWWA